MSVSACLFVSMYVCLFVCSSVHSHLENHVSRLHEIFCACYLWPWLGPHLTTMQLCYVLLVLRMTSCFPIMGHNMALWPWHVDVVAALMQVLTFPTYSPGCATLFHLISDDDMPSAATGWWLVACAIKAGGVVCCLRLPCSKAAISTAVVSLE